MSKLKLLNSCFDSRQLIGAAAFVIFGSAAIAQSVPKHLAAFATILFEQTQSELGSADPDTSKGWANIQALETLEQAGVSRWSGDNLPAWTGLSETVSLLQIEETDPDLNRKVSSFLKTASENGSQAALASYYSENNLILPVENALVELQEKMDLALSSGFEDLEREFTIEGNDRPDLKFDWSPGRGQFEILIDEPGDEYSSPFRLSLIHI